MNYLFYKNIYWKIYQKMLIPDIPPHIEIPLNKEDCIYLLKKTGAFLIRWPSEWDCEITTEWWYIISDNYNGITDLKSKTRNQVRKGLNNLKVAKVSKNVIINHGYEVYSSAFDKYNTVIVKLTQEEFINTVRNMENMDYWGVFEKESNKMVAYSINHISNNSCELKITKFVPNYLKLRPSEALFHTMLEYYLKNKNLLYVNDGARSISHDTNIQDFLIKKFNFRKAYCKLNIFYSKEIKIYVDLLYPFRKIVRLIPLAFSQKLYSLLFQEEIFRNQN